MEVWLRDNGRPALFEALNEAWSHIEGSYQNACHTESIRVAGLNGELQVLKARVARVDWLEQQNKTLRDELEQLRKPTQRQQRQQTQSPSQSRPELRTPLAPLSVNKARNPVVSVKHNDHPEVCNLSRDELVVEHTKLEKKYRKLRGQFSDSVEANELLQKQLRDNIQSREKWAEHAKTLEIQCNTRKLKIEKLKARLSSTLHNDDGVISSFASDAQSVADEGRVRNEQQPERSDMSHTTAPTLWPLEILGDASREPSVLGDTCETERAPSLPPLPDARGRVTQQICSTEPSSDTPIIVAERSVRKRRRDDGPQVQTPAATRIKLEGSSDPIVTSEQRMFMAHESIDFDNAEDRVETPRKTRITRSISRPAPRTAVRANWPAPKSRRSSSSSIGDQPPDTFGPHDSMSAHVQERELAAAQWREAVFQDEYTEEMDYGEPDDRSSALEAYNTIKLEPMARKPMSKAIVPSSLREGIASLAEDGNNVGSNSAPGGQHAARTGRLNNLLNNAVSPEREAINLPSGTRAKDIPTSRGTHFVLPPKRVLPFQQPSKVSSALKTPGTPTLGISKRAESAIKVNKTPLGALEKNTTKKEKPLRDRPAWSLKRTDFKLNPKFNDGYDYAFGDVVRGKARAELPGCTKEECCGKHFRPIALAQLPATGHIAFASLLETHLGDDAGRLGSMTKEEKEGMWVEAKILELSNKYGKHRERHSGMHEPPGWDRMGFPSTQEEEADREQAKRLELGEVELRHREAVKKGKYIFMDEDP